MKTLDLENIAEELEGMARSDKRQLVNRFAVLLAHLLKWQFQSQLRSKSWERTIKEQRKRILGWGGIFNRQKCCLRDYQVK